MAIDLSEERAIDARDSRFRAMLENLQGNILKAHGRQHVRLLFLWLNGTSPELVPWLRKTTRAVVTSAKRQLAEAEDNRMGRETGIFGNLFLTAAGYDLLG